MGTSEDGNQDVLYRFGSHLVSAGVDERDVPLGPPKTVLILSCYPVIRRTAKGAWIEYSGRARFVLLTARNKLACNTIEDAKESLRRRKLRQICIYRRRILDAEYALDLLEKGKY